MFAVFLRRFIITFIAYFGMYMLAQKLVDIIDGWPRHLAQHLMTLTVLILSIQVWDWTATPKKKKEDKY